MLRVSINVLDRKSILTISQTLHLSFRTDKMVARNDTAPTVQLSVKGTTHSLLGAHLPTTTSFTEWVIGLVSQQVPQGLGFSLK